MLSHISSILTFPLTQPVAIFLLVLLIMLASPVIFKPLRIPSVVGLIISGVLVGPYGFNLLARDASFEIFGEVGILFLMFQAAVEIDMFHLRRNMRQGIVFGLLTFLIPMALGIFTSRWAFGTDWTTCVLIGAMYSAHTLISYPAVSRFGLQNSRAAVIAVCGTIVAVLLALVSLAEAVDIHVAGGFQFHRLIILGMWSVVFVAVIGLTYPRLTRLFFRNFSDEVSQFIFILALVFISSLIAKIIGLEAILGAFYAGLVLNRFVPSRSALMSRFKFAGNAIFIPYFLIGVGMLINVHLLFKDWHVGFIAAVMGGVALGSKWLAAFTAGKLMGLTRVDRSIIFGLSSGKAAATIAAAMIGFQYGMLSEEVMNGAVIMILACCIVSAVTTERGARLLRMQITREEVLSESAPGHSYFARQLVAVANPITAEGLMKMAVFMRSRLNDQPVTTLYVRRNDDPESVAMGRNALRAASACAMAVDIETDDIERYDLNIVAGVTNVVKEKRITDIIIGLHRKSNIVDTFYGAFIEQLLKSTDKMIFMSRCFIPVDTVRRLVIIAPANAEYETGFRAWVERTANLATQLSTRVLFMTYPSTAGFIRSILKEDGYNLRHEFKEMSDWDDFIVLSSEIGEEDLMIVVSARKGSISCSADLDNLPGYLSRNFARQNLLVVYPQQFGEQ